LELGSLGEAEEEGSFAMAVGLVLGSEMVVVGPWGGGGGGGGGGEEVGVVSSNALVGGGTDGEVDAGDAGMVDMEGSKAWTEVRA
jgi:hypothetical protein